MQRTMSEIQIECLREQLVKENSLQSEETVDCSDHANRISFKGDKNLSLRESEAILVIKRLQEQVKSIFICVFVCNLLALSFI